MCVWNCSPLSCLVISLRLEINCKCKSVSLWHPSDALISHNKASRQNRASLYPRLRWFCQWASRCRTDKCYHFLDPWGSYAIWLFGKQLQLGRPGLRLKYQPIYKISHSVVALVLQPPVLLPLHTMTTIRRNGLALTMLVARASFATPYLRPPLPNGNAGTEKGSREFWYHLVVSIFLVLAGGAFAG